MTFTTLSFPDGSWELSACRLVAPSAEGSQQVHHIVIVFLRWRAAADDPVEQARIGAIEQSLGMRQLRAVQVSEMGLGKSGEYEVDLLRSAVPAAEEKPAAADKPCSRRRRLPRFRSRRERRLEDKARAALAGEIEPHPLVPHAQPILQLRKGEDGATLPQLGIRQFYAA